ncbi:MAG: protein translocase subunit SecDF [Bacteroidetes bacterium]|nr:MAG: protein translocase subunit SecDF [Bacteroidota bacterium]
MKNKNTIIFLLLVFVAICGYNLYWTYVQFSSDSRMTQVESAYRNLQLTKPDTALWTADDKMLKDRYESLAGDTAFHNRRKRAIERSFTLGLDLQGGMFVTLEVGIEDLIRQLASNPGDTALNGALACANQRQALESADFVSLFVECFKTRNPERPLGVTFSNEELGISVGSSDSEVEQLLQDEAKSAIDRTFNIIRTRIDQFGVVSPNLQLQEGTGRILLELPGVKEPERVRKLLRSTAKLEFYTNYSWREAYPVLVDINAKLRALQGLEDTASTETVDAPQPDETELAEIVEPDTTAEDTSFTSTENLGADDSTDVPFDQLSEAEQEARRREFERENPLWALLTPADFETFNRVGSESPMVGVVLASDTAKMRRIDQILAMEEIQSIIPPKMRFAWTFKPRGTQGGGYYELIAIFDDGTPALSGEEISLARQDFDPNNPSESIVSMRMTPEGTKEWARITEANVGKHISILLDGKVYSYPVVNDPIRNGNTQISGGFTIQEAQDLANVLKAGQLPVPARIEGEETVGPTLGAENITSGLNSFLLAFLVTLIFMGVYYARAGIVANVALLANLLFILGCSAAFTIVLTLPGIAAIVLTVGMAVDANVLIFERIREELARDKTLKASIKAGFSNAFSSVMDANITTFLTGVVLYAVGIGPIRGFAVSLMIGIITSLISALIITRLILDYYANKGKGSIAFGFSWTTGLFDKVKLQMVNRRKIFYGVSGGLVLVSLILMLTVGFKTGVDFKGGRQFVVEFTDANGNPAPLSDVDVEVIRGDLTAAFENNEPVIKTLRYDNQLMITTSYLVAERDSTNFVEETMIKGLDQNYSNLTHTVISTSDVGPTVASDIREAAYLSVIFSLLIIFFYILVRFRKWQYSLGAIVAVFHDVIITLGVFSLLSLFDLPFNVEINQAMIAALLTIIGYSINDTVVVFDRIRENIGEMKSSALSFIYNTSIDQTISRTLITSLTTFLTALILFLFGGDVIRGFVFAIMVGISVGTYSSIFVASPIALDTILRRHPELEKGQENA